MNDEKHLKAVDLISLFMIMIIFSIMMNYMIDAKLILCAICCGLFVIAFIVLTVIESFLDNKKLINTLKIICFILLAAIVITFFI
ncbi:MAG: hypothetical protein SOZ95_06705 [Bacilli bacterium]|nr:hypothetical protein [Bacilli bacterium]